MRVFHDFDSLSGLQRPCVTTGSFDGVHCGHHVLLDNVRSAARSAGGESVVLTLEPHPRIALGDSSFRLLTTIDEKIALLSDAGIDDLIIIPFDTSFRNLSAHDFIARYIVGRLGAVHMTVGYNHHFGHDRCGGEQFIQSISDEFGLQVEMVSRHDVGSDKVSSTAVRDAVAAGRMSDAGRLLGHPYIIIGMMRDGVLDTPDERKLMPPRGDYLVNIGGRQTTLHIGGGRIWTDEKFEGLLRIEF